jgi:hypothetical protein
MLHEGELQRIPATTPGLALSRPDRMIPERGEDNRDGVH